MNFPYSHYSLFNQSDWLGGRYTPSGFDGNYERGSRKDPECPKMGCFDREFTQPKFVPIHNVCVDVIYVFTGKICGHLLKIIGKLIQISGDFPSEMLIQVFVSVI